MDFQDPCLCIGALKVAQHMSGTYRKDGPDGSVAFGGSDLDVVRCNGAISGASQEVPVLHAVQIQPEHLHTAAPRSLLHYPALRRSTDWSQQK